VTDPAPHRPAQPAPARGFGRRKDGAPATVFTLQGGSGIVAKVTDHGATLVELHVPDRSGALRDVVLGFDSVEGYESGCNAYFGATIGRVANRIADAAFDLDGERYRLAPNEPPHHLHGGGASAFDKVRWNVAARSSDEVVLTHASPAGAEGYPGRVEVAATYRITPDDELVVRYEAATDAPTPLDLTNHTYWNLRGDGDGTVLEHELQVVADRTLAVDDELIPTGKVIEVARTPLDLRKPVLLGPTVRDLASTPALGLDHHYVLRRGGSGPRPAARLRDPASGRVLELLTDQPGLQVYSGNRLDPPVGGKRSRRYGRYGGICLEPHRHPDALHHPGFPSIVLRPGDTYRHTSVYRFSTC
jgi:aldose 1-epimerase